VDRIRAEMKVRTLANKLVRAGKLKKEFDRGLRFFLAPTEPVCICVPSGQMGSFCPNPLLNVG
jgi:hypothetical protein